MALTAKRTNKNRVREGGTGVPLAVLLTDYIKISQEAAFKYTFPGPHPRTTESAFWRVGFVLFQSIE